MPKEWKGRIIYITVMSILLVVMAYLLPFSFLKALNLIFSHVDFARGCILIAAQLCIAFFGFKWFRNVVEELEDLEAETTVNTKEF